INQSDGLIEVNSEPGKGAIFSIFLPPSSQSMEVMPDPVHVVYNPGQGETILLAEDDEGVRQFIRDTLQGGGYQVIEAAGGTEALKQSSHPQGHIDLLLSDIIMPRLGGRQLAARLSESRPDTKVLFVSGYTDPVGQGELILDAGQAFLQKPFYPH